MQQPQEIIRRGQRVYERTPEGRRGELIGFSEPNRSLLRTFATKPVKLAVAALAIFAAVHAPARTTVDFATTEISNIISPIDTPFDFGKQLKTNYGNDFSTLLDMADRLPGVDI